ncbi:hypothetical protein [Flavobacterium sp. W21_SRS_FM6]|uniref:hypothetical protein n=1 Tax=Flavobacterium sp. W21_SRS_FM6 TaxID=3240268 RepID=UPI003F8E4E89
MRKSAVLCRQQKEEKALAMLRSSSRFALTQDHAGFKREKGISSVISAFVL